MPSTQVVKWLEGCIDESKLTNIGVPLVWKHTAFEVEGDVTVVSNYKLDLQLTGSFQQDEWGPWKDRSCSKFYSLDP